MLTKKRYCTNTRWEHSLAQVVRQRNDQFTSHLISFLAISKYITYKTTLRVIRRFQGREEKWKEKRGKAKKKKTKRKAKGKRKSKGKTKGKTKEKENERKKRHWHGFYRETQ